MNADAILTRLSNVRQTGTGKWIARCPAHEDRSPSLAIKLTQDDERLLIHCFAGCSAIQVLDAINMTMADLFPSVSTGHITKSTRRPWSALDVLNALAFEVLVAFNYAKKMADGNSLSCSERSRLAKCAARINAGLGLINE